MQSAQKVKFMTLALLLLSTSLDRSHLRPALVVDHSRIDPPSFESFSYGRSPEVASS